MWHYLETQKPFLSNVLDLVVYLVNLQVGIIARSIYFLILERMNNDHGHGLDNGTAEGAEEYVKSLQKEWVAQLEELSKIGQSEPQAAYAAFTAGFV